MKHHNNRQFTTKDRDNDEHINNCAVVYHGAWWYRYDYQSYYYDCYDSNLNGKYFRGGQINSQGVIWHWWKNADYSLKGVKMKIRPNP